MSESLCHWNEGIRWRGIVGPKVSTRIVAFWLEWVIVGIFKVIVQVPEMYSKGKILLEIFQYLSCNNLLRYHVGPSSVYLFIYSQILYGHIDPHA